MLYNCYDCQEQFGTLKELKRHAVQASRQGRGFAAAGGDGCSGRYYKGTATRVAGGAAADVDMDRERREGLDAPPDPPDEDPGPSYHDGRRLQFVKHSDNLKLTCVEYFIARAALKLPARLGATVVQIVRFMRYTLSCLKLTYPDLV